MMKIITIWIKTEKESENERYGTYPKYFNLAGNIEASAKFRELTDQAKDIRTTDRNLIQAKHYFIKFNDELIKAILTVDKSEGINNRLERVKTYREKFKRTNLNKVYSDQQVFFGYFNRAIKKYEFNK